MIEGRPSRRAGVTPDERYTPPGVPWAVWGEGLGAARQPKRESLAVIVFRRGTLAVQNVGRVARRNILIRRTRGMKAPAVGAFTKHQVVCRVLRVGHRFLLADREEYNAHYVQGQPLFRASARFFSAMRIASSRSSTYAT